MRRRTFALLPIVALTAALTACGSSAPAATSTGDAANTAANTGGVTKITVGALPVGDYAAAYYAKAKGLFSAQGLDVTITPIQGGANSAPALLKGDFDIAVTNWISYVQAVGQKIPLRAVLPAASGAPGFSGIVALPNSGVTKPADLKGKVIAVNNLKALSELTSRVSLQENGVDPASVKFTQMPLPDMGAALANGSVQAAWVVEPFLTITQSKGAKVIVDPYAGKLKGAPIGGWSTTEKFAAANPGTLDKFARAMGEASKALEDDKTFREFLPSYSGLTPELAARQTFPKTAGTINQAQLDDLAKTMADLGWITQTPDLGSTLKYVRNVG